MGYKNMTIGERIRNRRIELDLTQDDLAARLGYKHRSSITRIEADGENIKQSQIVAFAHALNTSVAYIMGWEDAPDLLSELHDLWDLMDESQKRTFLSLGRALVNTNDPHTGKA